MNDRVTADNSQLVEKTFTVKFVLPFNTEANPESMLNTSSGRALGDLFIMVGVSPDFVEVTDVTARLLEGDEAQSSVAKINKILDDIKAKEEAARAKESVQLDAFLATLGL